MGAVYGKAGTQTIKNYKDSSGGAESEGAPLSPKSPKETKNSLFGEKGLCEEDYPEPDPADVANVFVTTPCEATSLAVR